MKTSTHALELLKEWEGFRNKMYPDSKGLPTIGVGHLLTHEELASGFLSIGGERMKWVEGLTDEQVIQLLSQDLLRFENAVNTCVHVELNQNQFDALVAFSFNIGVGAFKSSTALRLINEGNIDLVPNAIRMWNKAGGKVSQGLINRRENEIKLWQGEI